MEPGTRLGPYEIRQKIGAGGMGEVYRAHDPTLRREVAVKLLPETLAADAERLARLRREAHSLAALNHPNVATIYGFEKADGVAFLVLELVEGETLQDRLRSGPIPVDEALQIAAQIAEGLEAAHASGLIHRDLKPANIKITPEGRVKVLDFGLAKPLERRAPGGDQAETQSSTITSGDTGEGVLVGTAAYMSPEQARGQPLDERTDIWSFGGVLYEMLTGVRAFGHETVSDTLAGVLREEPDWEDLPQTLPLTARLLLQRCLRKHPRERLQSIGDARIEIGEALQEPAAGTAAGTGAVVAPSQPVIPWSTAVALSILAALVSGVAVWGLAWPDGAETGPVTRALIQLPPDAPIDPIGRPFTISPDGSRLVYTGAGEAGRQLYVHEMDRFGAQPIPGTEGAHTPFFSPNGDWVGFFADDGKLKKVTFDGRSPLTICDAPSESHGADWGPDDTIIFSPATSDLMRVSAGGGTPEAVATPDRDNDERGYYWPQFLPGGDSVLLTIWGGGGGIDAARIAVVSLATGDREILLESATGARYTPTGHLVYASGAGLLAVPFDAETLEITGDGASALDSVLIGGNFGAAYFAFSDSGSLAYLPGSRQTGRLVWVDRTGVDTALGGDRRDYGAPRLSPDGTRVATWSLADYGRQDIWIFDVERHTLTRATFEGDASLPVWMPDGEHIVFGSSRNGPFNLFRKSVDGAGDAEMLLDKDLGQFPTSRSRDGRLLAFYEVNPSTQRDIWILHLDPDGAAEPFIVTPSNERAPSFSPDGGWLAYVSDESGRDEIYVRPYPGPGGKRLISLDGGTEPVWAPGGGEIFYRAAAKVISVAVETSPRFRLGTPEVLFEGAFLSTDSAFGYPRYDVSEDGQHLLMVKGEQLGGSDHVRVVVNWFDELRQHTPTGR